MAEHEISAGFMPLFDSVVLITAREIGFAAKEGIDLKLSRETSWANIRDRIAIGHFDVAHTGDPHHDDLAWPAYELDRRATAVLDRSPAVVDDPEGELRRMWDEIDGDERPDGATPTAPGGPGGA